MISGLLVALGGLWVGLVPRKWACTLGGHLWSMSAGVFSSQGPSLVLRETVGGGMAGRAIRVSSDWVRSDKHSGV